MRLAHLVVEMLRITLVRSVCFFALVAVAGSAFAGLLDGTVLISRAANNKTITVTYDGIRAKMVELRINGESIATRSVSDEKAAGETKFALNPATLKDGENSIEVRVYDSAGKLVGNEKSSVTIDRSAEGPVFLKGPKAGSSVLGPVQIELGLRESLKDIYVSFFVDDEFKSLRNFPPYTYVLDTTRMTNGWHELQAWVVDQRNETHKTEKVRLYVNNPSGRTERMAPPGGPTPKAVASDPGAASTISGAAGTRIVKAATEQSDLVTTPSAPKSTYVASRTKVAEPKLTLVPEKAKPELSTVVGNSTTTASRNLTKSPVAGKGEMTGQRALLPTGTREVLPVVEVKIHEATEPGKPSDLALREIGFGSRINDIRTFDIILNGSVLNFDVAPRVLEGIPFAPFRHLFEGAGGTVKWIHDSKIVEAEGLGNQVSFKIGMLSGTNNGLIFKFERAPFLESGRTVVPLSFVNSTLDIKVQYDPNTGHVLLTSSKGK